MASYRAYQVQDGRILGEARILAADEDQEAIAQARSFVDGHDVELWTGNRLVTTLSSRERKNATPQQ
jgi:hypothetical protein